MLIYATQPSAASRVSPHMVLWLTASVSSVLVLLFFEFVDVHPSDGGSDEFEVV